MSKPMQIDDNIELRAAVEGPQLISMAASKIERAMDRTAYNLGHQ